MEEQKYHIEVSIRPVVHDGIDLGKSHQSILSQGEGMTKAKAIREMRFLQAYLSHATYQEALRSVWEDYPIEE